MTSKSLIIGITSASGTAYGIRMLEILKECGLETHLVMSKASVITLATETDKTPLDLQNLATHYYQAHDIAAPIASGSFKNSGMIIAPCSIRTMSEIATGVTSSLLTRAADVTLKESRKLVMMVRETPLHTGHLRTMTCLAEMGVIIAPPVPAFYNRPQTLDDIINHSVGRVLDLFDIDTGSVKRWTGK